MGRSDKNKTHRDNFILSPWLINCLDPLITARAHAFCLILQQKHFLCHWRGRNLICIITCISSSRDLVKTTSLSKYRKRGAEVGERCSLRDKVATFNWISEKCPGKFAPQSFLSKAPQSSAHLLKQVGQGSTHFYVFQSRWMQIPWHPLACVSNSFLS